MGKAAVEVEAVMARRRHPIADADNRNPMGGLTPDQFYAKHAVSHTSSSFVNARGLRIHHQSWTPLLEQHQQPLGIVCIVHGFTMESGWITELTAVYFAEAGFAVCGIDHQGHGKSEGLSAYIPHIRPVVDDCVTCFDAFRARYPASLPSFLYAESLGGAISLLIHLGGESKRPWTGLVLCGAMCSISRRIKPPWPLEHLLTCAASIIPTWPVAVTRGNVAEASFRVRWKRKLAIRNSKRHFRMPRTATAKELLRVCRELQGRFDEVTLPLLIVHGGDDSVCDPEEAKKLYNQAPSKDKKLKIYPGMWHMPVGEPDDMVDLVFGDILRWLVDHTRPTMAAATTAVEV